MLAQKQVKKRELKKEEFHIICESCGMIQYFNATSELAAKITAQNNHVVYCERHRSRCVSPKMKMTRPNGTTVYI